MGSGGHRARRLLVALGPAESARYCSTLIVHFTSGKKLWMYSR